MAIIRRNGALMRDDPMLPVRCTGTLFECAPVVVVSLRGLRGRQIDAAMVAAEAQGSFRLDSYPAPPKRDLLHTEERRRGWRLSKQRRRERLRSAQRAKEQR